MSKFMQLCRLNCPAVLMKERKKKFYLQPLRKSIWAILKLIFSTKRRKLREGKYNAVKLPFRIIIVFT